MGQPIPAQHPSVVLRSHFRLVKALLAMALVAVVALAAAVVILANDDDEVDRASTATPAVIPQPQSPAGTRYDGGPEEGTRGAVSIPQTQAPVSRYDGGPEEGTRGATSFPQTQAPVTRYDGGPEEGSHAPIQQFKERAGGPRMIPQGPGSR
jgi:hypothetical protein